MLAHLECESLVSVAVSVIYLSHVTSWKLCEIRAKFCHPYKKLGSEGKNMTLDFALEIAKYPQNPQIAKNGDLDN